MKYKNKHQRELTKKLLLDILFAGSVITVGLTAPNALLLFKPFVENGKVDRERLSKRLNRLEREGLISVAEDEDGVVTLELSERGKKKALRYKIEDLVLKKPERWDGKWRIVMFDIPNDKKTARDYFKQTLDQLGFIQIQKSIYAHPYECKEEIELIRSVYEIRPYVKMMQVEDFEGEHRFLGRFGLAKKFTEENIFS